METVVKNVVDPDTGQEYEIELPAPEVVRKAILELNYPPDGIKVSVFPPWKPTKSSA